LHLPTRFALCHEPGLDDIHGPCEGAQKDT
jgi:hypothetical protein